MRDLQNYLERIQLLINYIAKYVNRHVLLEAFTICFLLIWSSIQQSPLLFC